MLKHVVEKNQTELIELINSISPTIETFPTDDENHTFNRLCEALHQESIRPVDDSTRDRKMNARKNMNIFLENLQATNLLHMISHAVNLNQSRTFWLLTSHADNIHERDIDGNTVLHLMAKLNETGSGWNSRLISHLLKKRCRLDAINSEKKSAIDIAAEVGNIRMVEALLSVGANIFGNQGSTSTLDLIHTVMLAMPVGEKTPLLNVIERTVKLVDNAVRISVDEKQALVIQERNIAVMMITHKRLGNQSGLKTLDENILKSMILEEVNRVYTDDYLRNLDVVKRRHMIMRAFDIHVLDKHKKY